MKFIKRTSNSKGVVEELNPQQVSIKTENLSVLGNTEISGDVVVSGKVFSTSGYSETITTSGSNVTLKRFDIDSDITSKCVISGTSVLGSQASELLLVIKDGTANSVEYGNITSSNELYSISLVVNGQFVDLIANGVDVQYTVFIQALVN